MLTRHVRMKGMVVLLMLALGALGAGCGGSSGSSANSASAANNASSAGSNEADCRMLADEAPKLQAAAGGSGGLSQGVQQMTAELRSTADKLHNQQLKDAASNMASALEQATTGQFDTSAFTTFTQTVREVCGSA